MKYMFVFISLTFISFSSALAGSWSDWIYQNSYPTANALLGVHFITPKNGWIVGASGMVLSTKDAGTNWKFQESGTEEDLKNIFFVDNKIGWAVGNAGTIIYTKNGGESWEKRDSIKVSLHKVFFLDEREGWIGGDEGTLLYTKDGGQSWEKKALSRSWPVAGIFFINRETGWILQGSEIHRTVDGGARWITTPLPEGPSSGSEGKAEKRRYKGRGQIFFSNKNGWAVLEQQAIFRTDDAGETWERKDIEHSVLNMAFTSEKNGCVGGKTILCTTDAGKSWTDRLGAKPNGAILEGNLINIQAISFVGKSEGWAVGGSGRPGSNEGQLLKTEDGGETWRLMSHNFRRGYFTDSKSGWRAHNDFQAEQGSILRTTDGGNRWVVQKKFDHNVDIHSFFFINPEIGWAVGQTRTHSSAGTKRLNYFILHTSDGGTTWNTQLNEQANQRGSIDNRLYSIYSLNSDKSWVAGSGGRILHTKDGGQHWEVQESGTKSDLVAIRFIDENRGWAVGNALTDGSSTSFILYTENAGKDWKVQWKKKAKWMWLYDMHFADGNTGWVAGDINEYSGDCILLRTVDGGKTWLETEFDGIKFQQLGFVDKTKGAIVTGKSHVLTTDDGGNTWKKGIKPLHRKPWHISELLKTQ